MTVRLSEFNIFFMCVSNIANMCIYIFSNKNICIFEQDLTDTSKLSTDMTEEELFMSSTVQNNFDVEIQDIKTFKLLWEMYFDKKE